MAVGNENGRERRSRTGRNGQEWQFACAQTPFSVLQFLGNEFFLLSPASCSCWSTWQLCVYAKNNILPKFIYIMPRSGGRRLSLSCRRGETKTHAKKPSPLNGIIKFPHQFFSVHWRLYLHNV